jgi:hypothetical protein
MELGTLQEVVQFELLSRLLMLGIRPSRSPAPQSPRVGSDGEGLFRLRARTKWGANVGVRSEEAPISTGRIRA